MHAGAAVQLNTATLMLSADQADAITTAGARVARHYDIAVLDPKWQDWFAFAGIMAKTYGGMAMAFLAERRMREAGIAPPGEQPATNGAADPYSTGGIPAVVPHPSGMAVN